MKSLGKTIKNDKKTKADVYLDPTTKKFKVGNPGGGRPPETLSFSTKWFAFMERIAKENGVSTSELDHKMMTVAFKQMQDGKFPYWKDVNDRLYGQAKQAIEHSGEVKTLIIDV